MKYEDETKEQLISELVEMQKNIRELIHSLGQPLTVVKGDITLAIAIIMQDNQAVDRVLERLNEAASMFKEIERIIQQLSLIAYRKK